MDLLEVMRHLPAVREYEDRDVPDDVLYDVLDAARFAPSGGNRQGWRVVVVRDPEVKRQLRDLYLVRWQDYVARHYGPYDAMTDDRRRRVDDADRYAAGLDRIPVHLAIWVDMAAVEVTDADAGRPSVVGGGSVFPFVQNLQLAAADAGLGTRITTLLSACEEDVRALLRAPDGLALAAVVVLGWPKVRPTRLSRHPVEAFARQDTFEGPPLARSGR